MPPRAHWRRRWLDAQADACDEPVTVLDGPHDAALAGLVWLDGQPRAVYDRSRLRRTFERQGMTASDADEWIDFNIDYTGSPVVLLAACERGA